MESHQRSSWGSGSKLGVGVQARPGSYRYPSCPQSRYGVPIDLCSPLDPGSEAAQMPREVHVLAVRGFDRDEDAAVFVGDVAAREGYRTASEGREDSISVVAGVVYGELVVGVASPVTATVLEPAVGVRSEEH